MPATPIPDRMKKTWDEDPVQMIINTLSALAIVLYFLAILVIGIPYTHSMLKDNALTYMSTAVTAVSGTLATFFGAVMGLGSAKAGAGTGGAGGAGGGAGGAGTKHGLTGLQLWAAVLYPASLLLASALWAVSNFSEHAADSIRNMAITFPGVLVGSLAVGLNFKQTSTPTPTPTPTPIPTPIPTSTP